MRFVLVFFTFKMWACWKSGNWFLIMLGNSLLFTTRVHCSGNPGWSWMIWIMRDCVDSLFLSHQPRSCIFVVLQRSREQESWPFLTFSGAPVIVRRRLFFFCKLLFWWFFLIPVFIFLNFYSTTLLKKFVWMMGNKHPYLKSESLCASVLQNDMHDQSMTSN